ncbi:MAG TPA: Sua5/YciO/YrdC/YwlC family protein, partial [Egibacteraceae bacterium]|nr:Sua5/YciO/YrdC/YwlC family protein [Egibacteraceae bacterium]
MSEEIPTLIPAEDADTARDRVVEVLRDGGMAVIPTDAGYAIVADAFNQPATRKVFAVKRQRRQAPLSVLIRSPRQVGGLAAEIPEAAERLMASYWPGPLTLIFRAQEG